MEKKQNDTYKGYVIVTGSSGGASHPYTADFGIAVVQTDGTCGPIENHVCDAQYQTEMEAHAVANIAARRLIDSTVSKTVSPDDV